MKGRGHHDNKHIRRGGVGENKEDGGLVIVYRRLLKRQRVIQNSTEGYKIQNFTEGYKIQNTTEGYKIQNSLEGYKIQNSTEEYKIKNSTEE